MWGRKKRSKRTRWYDGCDCDICDVCDLPFCDFGLISSMLLLIARSGRPEAAPGSPSARVVSAAIRGYRRVSPRLPTRCRYTPTCSAYGLEAVRRYGTRRGLRLTAGRLSRCRPGVAYGTADPVP
ncbi:membrane protein insertion efficiency factor YidD [Couchioplanes caeruleus]|uniref:membrane protein insertion efficiency factor YidD n=1 Tax=Couchioplanes caeruleus TaxID=56438 RepID=UPI0020BE2155|nr:membrane protein insertion efficiency factor YidD [Couchioplanes caeruleus]UQU67055.1 membrane protein insertion efficiency factor YidD [Couchioplanes caeruleus]